jgi:hypothetical protein
LTRILYVRYMVETVAIMYCMPPLQRLNLNFHVHVRTRTALSPAAQVAASPARCRIVAWNLLHSLVKRQ